MSKNQPPREHSASETLQWHRARGFRLPQRGHRPLLLTWMFLLHQTGKQNKSAHCNQRKRWFCPPQSNSPTVWVWSNQSILKEISPGISLEGMMLKLKLQYFGHLLRRVDSLERLWCWEGLGAGGEGDNRGWDGWMASPTRWTWVWVNSRSWLWTGRPGMLWFMGSQRVRHEWVTELTDWLTDSRKTEIDKGQVTKEKVHDRVEFWIDLDDYDHT